MQVMCNATNSVVSPKSQSEIDEDHIYALFDEHVNGSRSRRQNHAVAVEHRLIWTADDEYSCPYIEGLGYVTLSRGPTDIVVWTVDPFGGDQGPGLYTSDGVCSGYLTLAEVADFLTETSV